MRILIANDDGVYAPGIMALANEFAKEHDVTVVAPDCRGAEFLRTVHDDGQAAYYPKNEHRGLFELRGICHIGNADRLV